MRTPFFYIFLTAALACGAGAAGNSWNKLRYRGGTVAVRVNPFDWNTTLTVREDEIVLQLGPRQTLKLKPAQIVGLSYGPEALKRVSAQGSVNSAPGLFGLLKPGHEYVIGIVYELADGRRGAVLLESQKSECWVILQVLKGLCGRDVEQSQ